jgi:UDP-2-acetamido-3-amino-2,3-dideoxy-glucuronate N-acetyltransferase
MYFKHPTAIVDSDSEIGEGTKIWHFSHICAGAKIGKNCSFGQNVYVAPGVVIGDNVKVQNGVSIYSGVIVGDFCFLGPHCVFTNDKYPRAIGAWTIQSTVLQKGVSIGANATVMCGLILGEYAMVGSGSVVVKDVPAKALVVGNPARVRRFFTAQEIESKFGLL